MRWLSAHVVPKHARRTPGVNLIESRLVAQFLVVGAQAGGLNIPWLRDGSARFWGSALNIWWGRISLGRPLDFELLHARSKRTRVKIEYLSCAGRAIDDAVGAFEHSKDMFLLDIFQRAPNACLIWPHCRLPKIFGWANRRTLSCRSPGLMNRKKIAAHSKY